MRLHVHVLICQDAPSSCSHFRSKPAFPNTQTMNYAYPAASMLNDAKLNCQGILMLQEGRPFCAIQCFSEGLRSILSTLQSEEERVNQSDGNIPICRPGMLFSVELPQNQVKSDNGGGFVIYNRPLHLSFVGAEDDMTLSSMVPETDLNLLCTVLLFNLGLVHHMVAMEQGGSSKMISKASEFYSMAYRLLPQPDDETVCERTGLAHLALANNLGHIHFFLFRFEQAKVCVNALVDWLSAAQTGSESGSDMSNKERAMLAINDVDNVQYQTFMLNASFSLMTMDLMSAPAA